MTLNTNRGTERAYRTAPDLGNQRGIALVISLIMLVLMGLLGAMALSRSSTELHIAGNYRNLQIAYYNADIIEAWGPNNPTVLTAIRPYVVNTYTAAVPVPAGSTGTRTVTVTYLCTSNVIGTAPGDPNDYVSWHYLMTVVGRGTSGAEFVVESEVVRNSSKPGGWEQDC